MFMYLFSEDCPPEVRKQFGPNKKCAVVYTFLGANDKVLYVGKTTNFCSRWSAHFRSKKSILNIVRIVIRTYRNYAEASFVEAQEIAKLQPLWNTQGKSEKASRKKMPHVAEFSLKPIVKRLVEFRESIGDKVPVQETHPAPEFTAKVTPFVSDSMAESIRRLDAASEEKVREILARQLS